MPETRIWFLEVFAISTLHSLSPIMRPYNIPIKNHVTIKLIAKASFIHPTLPYRLAKHEYYVHVVSSLAAHAQTQ